MNKVEKNAAIAEINEWLDVIDYEGDKIGESDNDDSKSMENMFVDAVCDGYITFDEQKQLICKLKNPVKDKEGKVVLDELTFATSLPVYKYNNAMKGIKADDADKRMIATIGAFSNKATSVIDRMSTKQIRILQVIAGYLL